MLTFSNNGATVFTYTIAPPTNLNDANGSVLYFGYINTTQTFNRVTFGNTQGNDSFGFDDMTIGSVQQVTPSTVPEPGEWATMGMAGAGLCGLMVRARRKKASTTLAA